MSAPLFPPPADSVTVTHRGVEFPAGRYGRRRAPVTPRRWLWWGAAALAILGLTAGVGRWYFALNENRVTAQLVGYSVKSDNRVDVTFEVVASVGDEARCAVRARDHSGAEVGRDIVHVEITKRPTRVTHNLATTGTPVSGELLGCRSQQ